MKTQRFTKRLILAAASIFQVQKLIPEEKRLGALPQTKRAYSSFFSIAWPSALESMLISLVGAMDTMMVGVLGKEAIAAVGITNQPKFVLLACSIALNAGVTAVSARRKGEEDQEGANHVLRASLCLCAGIAVLMTLIGLAFSKQILLFAGAEELYLEDAVRYFRYIAAALLFQAVTMTINAAQRGTGYTKISMYTNIAANGVNVLLNYLLINGIWIFPRMEVRGAGLATFIGTGAGCFVSVISLFRRKPYVNFFVKAGWSFKKKVLRPILKVSSSALIEQVFMRIGFLAYAVIVARLGTTSYATHLICMNVIGMSFAFGEGFGIAASSLVGQNLGASRADLSSLYGKVGQRIAFLMSTILFVIFIIGRRFFISLFSTDAEVIALGAQIMIIIAFTTHFQTSQVVLNGCLRGAGDSSFVAVTSLISIAIIRPVLTWILCFPAGLGLIGSWISLIADQVFRFFTAMRRFNNGKWARIKL